MRGANVTSVHGVRLFLRAQIKSSSRDRARVASPSRLHFFFVLFSSFRSRNHGELIKASGLGIKPEVRTFDHTSTEGGNSVDDKVLRPLPTSNDLLQDKK